MIKIFTSKAALRREIRRGGDVYVFLLDGGQMIATDNRELFNTVPISARVGVYRMGSVLPWSSDWPRDRVIPEQDLTEDISIAASRLVKEPRNAQSVA